MSDVLPPIPVPAAEPSLEAGPRALRPPSCCLRKTKGLAYVRLNGEFIYLGRYGSPESHAEYRHLIAEWITSRAAELRHHDVSS
jgi:hypothetical protein